jgi:integrase
MKTQTRRSRGDGGLRLRRPGVWELKYLAAAPSTRLRQMRTMTFRGNETQARAQLRKLVKAADDGLCAAPARHTISDVIDTWERGLTVSPKTAERYRELSRLYIRPHLGAARLAGLRTSRFEEFYRDLVEGRDPTGALTGRPLAPRTALHVHRLVVQALSIAERDGLISSNPARNAKRPKIERREIEILSAAQVSELLRNLRGRSLQKFVLLALATGARRGELCALRWQSVDLDAGLLRIVESLEQTKPDVSTSDALARRGLRFRAPKTHAGARTISLPHSVIGELRTLKREQAEERLKLGLGREADDALVFRQIDPATGTFGPLLPNNISTAWRKLVTSLKMPKVSFHALRHTHASQLIDAQMDVVTVSRRLGHGSPAITLSTYAHRFRPADGAASAVFDAAFSDVLGEQACTEAVQDRGR